MFIISIIVYNICYYPEIIKEIIVKNKKKIKKFLVNKQKTDEEQLRDNAMNIEIKDNFDNEIIQLSADYYLLFQNDKLINNSAKGNDLIYNNDVDNINNKNEKVKKEYKMFFEDFKLILTNKMEIEKYYLPELLLFKYLSKLII
jgi:hypothetical protein